MIIWREQLIYHNFSTEGKPIPTELRKEAEELMKEIQLEDDVRTFQT